MIYIKIHQSYRNVVGICDSELIGKKFEDKKRQLEIKESFFKEIKADEQRTIKIIQNQAREDATFNIVGKNSVNIAIKANLISKEQVDKIQNIPFSIVFI